MALQFCPLTNIAKLKPGDGVDNMVQIEDMQISNALHTHDGTHSKTDPYTCSEIHKHTYAHQAALHAHTVT